MATTPSNDTWPTKDSEGDARGLPGYPKGPDSESTGGAGGIATTPDDQHKERPERDGGEHPLS
jgi:hypothetical protein